MLDVIDVKHLHDYVLWLRFDDGIEGEVDLRDDLWGEAFEPLHDVEVFRRVVVNSETGTIAWPNGADLAPEFLRARVLGDRNVCDSCGLPFDGTDEFWVVIKGGRKDEGSWTLHLCDRCVPASAAADTDQRDPVSFEERLADAVSEAVVEAGASGRELTLSDVREIASKVRAST